MRLLLIAALLLGACRGTRIKRASPPPTDSEKTTQNRLVGRGGHNGAPGAQTLTTRLGIYHTPDNGDGNPFLDEELTVVEPVVIYDRNVNDRLGITATFSYDYVSSASIDRLSKFPEQSGASADNFVGLNFAARYKLSDFMRVGGHVGFATEYDYKSVNLGGSLSLDSDDKNSTYTFTLDTFFDRIDIIRFNGSEAEGSDDRFSIAGGFNWYRALSSTTHGEFGALLSHQTGFLETAYNAVVLEDPTLPPNPNLENLARGTEITEELPTTRWRGSVHGRVRHFLEPGRAVELGGRLYADSWGIMAFSLEPRIYQDISESVRLQVGYRFYAQSEADSFADSFTVATRHRTQDSDLGDFMSHGITGRVTWAVNKKHTVDFGLGYTSRDDGLDRVTATFGWVFKW